MVYICRCLPFTLVLFQSDILYSRWQYNISIYHSVEYELNCYTCIVSVHVSSTHVPPNLFLHVHELECQVIKEVLSFFPFLSVHLTVLKIVQDCSECLSWNVHVEWRRNWPKATYTCIYMPLGLATVDCMYNTCTTCTCVRAHTICSGFSASLAKDLIRGLLKTNPDERFKIDDVLRHPWIYVRVYISTCIHVDIYAWLIF